MYYQALISTFYFVTVLHILHYLWGWHLLHISLINEDSPKCSFSLASHLLLTLQIADSLGAGALAGLAGVDLAHTCHGVLSAVRSRAALLLGGVHRTAARHGTLIDANAVRPGPGVVRVKLIKPPGLGGRRGGRRGEGGEARTAGLTPV